MKETLTQLKNRLAQKPKGKLVIFVLFVVFICMWRVLWFFCAPLLDTEDHENRVWVERPELTFENYGNYSRSYNNYFNDHLPFRNNAIAFNSMMEYHLFHRSGNPHVIIGKDGWLYYNSSDADDPMGYYMGKEITEEELQIFVGNLTQLRDTLLAENKEFIFMIVPGKERVYPEYLPGKYGAPSEVYKTQQLVDYLRENTDIRVVYPLEDLLEAKEVTPYNLYYKTDTHWNWLGGYVGTRALLRELGIDMPPLESFTITQQDYRVGDLSEMLDLEDHLAKADPEYVIEGFVTPDKATAEEGFFESFDYAGREPGTVPDTMPEPDMIKLYVNRDSFGTSMKIYLGSMFSETHMRHYLSYSYVEYLERNPDIFVYEVAERYVNNIGGFHITDVNDFNISQ